MGVQAELSATASLSVLAAAILFSCCCYYFLSKRLQQRNVDYEQTRRKSAWSLMKFLFRRRRSDADRTPTDSRRSFCVGDMVKSGGKHSAVIVDETAKTNRLRDPVTAALPDGSHIQIKQAKLHRWIFTPSCHLAPITEESFNNNESGVGAAKLPPPPPPPTPIDAEASHQAAAIVGLEVIGSSSSSAALVLVTTIDQQQQQQSQKQQTDQRCEQRSAVSVV